MSTAPVLGVTLILVCGCAADTRGPAGMTGDSAATTETSAASSANDSKALATTAMLSSGKPSSGDASTPQTTGATAPDSLDPTSGTNAAAGSAATTTRSASAQDSNSSADASSDDATTQTTWQQAFPAFERHEIAMFASGYYTVAVDVDQDGLRDVVALSSGNAGLVWFKNPSWEQYTITTATQRFICVAAHDVDADGDADLAIASEFDMNDSNNGGTVYLAEAPEDPTTNQEWTLHYVDAVPTAHRLRFGDIDGDGNQELLNLPIFGIGSNTSDRAGAVQFKAYSVPRMLDDTWQGRVLDDSRLEVAHGFSVVDWDGDAARDILTATNAGVYLFQPSLGTEPKLIGEGKDGMRPNRGSSEVSLGALAAERFVATIEPWHGTDAVVYTPAVSEAGTWARQVLGADFEHGHALVTADLNGDGYDEIVAGGGEGDRAQLIYRYVPTSKSWQKIELDVGGVAVAAMAIADLNADGALDIVSIGGSPTNNVVWYENVAP